MAKGTQKKSAAADGYSGSVTLRNARISERKARLCLDLVRGKDVDSAVRILQFNVKKGAAIVLKLLKSAISNARESGKADVDRLFVAGGWVDRGPMMKRSLPRSKGSATPILKRSAHITIELKEL